MIKFLKLDFAKIIKIFLINHVKKLKNHYQLILIIFIGYLKFLATCIIHKPYYLRDSWRNDDTHCYDWG